MINTDRELFHILLNAGINLLGKPEPTTTIGSTVQINHTDSSLSLTAGFKGYPAPTVIVSGATFPLKSLTPQVHTLSDCSEEVGVSVVWGTEDEGERMAANGRHITWSAGDGITTSVTLSVTCKYANVFSLNVTIIQDGLIISIITIRRHWPDHIITDVCCKAI